MALNRSIAQDNLRRARKKYDKGNSVSQKEAEGKRHWEQAGKFQIHRGNVSEEKQPWDTSEKARPTWLMKRYRNKDNTRKLNRRKGLRGNRQL